MIAGSASTAMPMAGTKYLGSVMSLSDGLGAVGRCIEMLRGIPLVGGGV